MHMSHEHVHAHELAPVIAYMLTSVRHAASHTHGEAHTASDTDAAHANAEAADETDLSYRTAPTAHRWSCYR